MKKLLSLSIIITCMISFESSAQDTTRPSKFILHINQQLNDSPIILSKGTESVVVEKHQIRGNVIVLTLYLNQEYTLTINGDQTIPFKLLDKGRRINNKNLNIIAATIQSYS